MEGASSSGMDSGVVMCSARAASGTGIGVSALASRGACACDSLLSSGGHEAKLAREEEGSMGGVGGVSSSAGVGML